MSSKRSVSVAMFLAVVLAVFLSFWALDRNDVVTDEASYMARGIGMLDFNFGIEQPTPIQWVQSVPWWMKFSFHDHPLLVFLFEKLFFGAFGENVFAGRVPAALAGVVSVVLLYFIGRELYSKSAGAISALLFAVTVGHVWISRVALQESIVIVLMLAGSYCFIRSLGLLSSGSIDQSIEPNTRWLLAASGFLGISFLAKYTALILVPIFLTVLLFKRRDYLSYKNFYFILSILCFLVVISPVIIYNIGLYHTFGHFDFQLSYVFGQKVAAWSEMPGKEDIGSLGKRFNDYLPTLFKINSPFFLLLSFGGLLLMLRQAKLHIIFFSFFVWLAASMLVVSPTERFLTMLVPWLSISAAFSLTSVSEFVAFRVREVISQHSNILQNVGMFFIFTIIAFEAFYSYNSVIALSPVGGAPWAYAAEVRRDNYNWGYNQLENFISSELAGKRPEPAVSFDYPVISRLIDKVVGEDAEKGFEPKPWMIIYNGNQSLGAQLWIFLRRSVYHGWPTVDVETYRKVIAENGPEYFKKLGIKEAYFVQNTKGILLREVRTRPLTSDGDILEARVKDARVKPHEIKNLRGDVAFLVYKFAP